jgi:hypothetical protein
LKVYLEAFGRNSASLRHEPFTARRVILERSRHGRGTMKIVVGDLERLPARGEDRIEATTVELDDGDPIPRLDDADALLVFGGPMNVDEEARLPRLGPETAAIRDAATGGLPLLGVCLGGQLLAKGARRPGNEKPGARGEARGWDRSREAALTVSLNSVHCYMHPTDNSNNRNRAANYYAFT